MRSIGSFLVIMGVGSIALHFFNYEFKLLMWIENWGPTVGWVIRGAMIVVGGIIWAVSGGSTAQSRPEATG